MHRIAILATVLLLVPFVNDAAAQEEGDARLGGGLGATLSTQDGIGLSVRTRASSAINQDISAAVDMGITGYILGGTADAKYIFDPQLTAIVNLPMQDNVLPYAMGGVGAHVPITQAHRSVSGPTIHLGLGRVHPLQESALYYEVNPALLISDERLDLIIPIRVGLIIR